MLTEGQHTVNATAFDAPNGTGRGGELYEIDFTLTRSVPISPDGAPATLPGTGTLAMGGKPPSAGTGGLIPTAGTGVTTSPVLGTAGGSAFPTVTPTPGIQDASGCSCRVPGVGVSGDKAQNAWTLAALAFGLFLWRRRGRAARP
jgi:MYXO-CTERM domain-containing protein